MADYDLKEIHDFLVQVADRAGKMITTANPQPAGSGMKKNSADLVTETDQAVEAMVSKALKEKYPSFKFMGEETYEPGMKLTAEPTFVVDPIDGTTNFVHASSYVSISMGVAIGREPVVGVVYNPFTGTLYSAVKGQGAFLNGTQPLPIKGSSAANARALEPLTSLDQALVAVEWGSDRSGPDYETKLKTYAKLTRSKEDGGAMVHGLRSLGSAALNLCAVAEGSLDVYWESGCWAWDVCAGMCILREAGGMVVDGNPGRWEVAVDDRRYLAARKGADRRVIEEFWSCVDGELSYRA